MSTNSPLTTSTTTANVARGTGRGSNTSARSTGTARGRGRGSTPKGVPMVPFRAPKPEKSPAEKAVSAFRLLNPTGFRRTTLFQGGQFIDYDELMVEGSWVTMNVAAEMLQQKEVSVRTEMAISRSSERLGRTITSDELSTLSEGDRSLLFMSAKEWRARRGTPQAQGPSQEGLKEDSVSQETEEESA